MSDHRASAEYRALMLGNALRKLYARHPHRERRGRRHERARRRAPPTPSSASPPAHESAALHATGRAMYTDDLAGRTAGVLTAWPVQSTSAHARVAVDVSGAYRVPGVVRVLTADDVPGEQRRGRQARRAALPDRGDVPRPRPGLGARRDARGRPTGRRRRDGRLRAASEPDHRDRGDRRRVVPGRDAHGRARRRRRARWAAPRSSSRA